MKNKLNKQILSALLAVLILVSAFPNTAYSVENETEPTVSVEATEIPTTNTEATEEPTAVTETSEISTTSTEAAMSEIVDGEETETTAATEEVETPSEGEEEADVSCPYCELTVAEDGAVSHADDCNTRFAVDASGRVGKTAAFNMDYDYVHYSNSKPAEGFDYNSEDDGKSDYLTAWYDSFDPPLVEITNWFWEVSGCALWYQVRPLSGETLPKGMTTESWLYQTSTNISGDINALVMVSADVLGKNVVFAQATAQLYNDYFAPMGVDGTQMPAMTVVDLYANNAETWYYVDAAEGETWPEAYADYHYVLSTDVVIQTPADPEDPTEPENPCDCGCENCTGEEGCACKCGQCDFCQREFEDGPITGSAGGKTVTVSGDKIPAGATVSVSDLSSAAGGDTGIYNIKVMDGDKVWQPAPGETVRVSIPAPAGANTATVFHFLEDPDNIKYALDHGHAQKVDISSAIYDKNYYILANAVKAYQDAYDSSKTVVVVEYFPNVAVQNGVVNIDAHGFSVFTSVPPADINATTPVFPGYGLGAQYNYYSVRPDEWIELTANVIIGDISINSDYVEVIRDSNFGLFSSTSIYIHVYPDIDTTSEKKFTASTLLNARNITFTIVPDFDYGNLYIGVVGHDTDFPNEVALHSAAQPDFYYNANGTLTTSKGNPNRLYPGTLINLDGVKSSNALVYNTAKTVYGIADNTGGIVTPFLKTGNNVGGDGNTYPGLTSLMASIKTAYLAYYAEQGQTLAPDDYLIVPYVIKHETIGSNVGWYVNFKVVKKDTFSLSYEYNEPLGFNAMEDIVPQKKPEGKSYDVYYSEENDRLEAEGTVMNGAGMTITKSGNNPDVATFVGWSTDPSAQARDYKTGVDDNWYEAGEKIIMTGDTTLYAIWSTNKTYTVANVQFQKLVATDKGVPYETNREFTFSVDSKFDGLQYAIFDEAGQEVASRQTFSSGARSFKLKAKQYIVIYDVKNSNQQYVITETVPEGYSAPNGGVAYGTINATTNTSGQFILNFTNTIATYPITYNLDYGTVDGTNPDTYCIETEEFTLINPTRKGYTFAGWTGTGLDAATMTVTIPKGSTGDREYTAHWTPNVLTITQSGVQPADTVLYQITGNDFSMTLPISGSKQVTIEYIPEGTYTIQEIGNWTWKYSGAKSDTVNIVDGTGEVTFSFGFPFSRWLHDEAHN